MNIERALTLFITGAVGIALATTIFGRSNSARVIDSAGRAFSGVISASLGKGVDIR